MQFSAKLLNYFVEYLAQRVPRKGGNDVARWVTEFKSSPLDAALDFFRCNTNLEDYQHISRVASLQLWQLAESKFVKLIN